MIQGNIAVKAKRLHENAKLPKRSTADSAGADLCACLQEPLLLPAHCRATVPTGIAIELAAGTAGFVFGRSGLGIRNGIVPSNAVGVIDADYRGEIIVGLSNYSDENYTIQPGERIAQLVIMPIIPADFVEAQDLSDTARGDGGFGSTGKK